MPPHPFEAVLSVSGMTAGIGGGNHMAKKFEPNEDWIKREGGLIPTKGAAAAERASAGLGTLTDDEALLAIGIDPRVVQGRSAEQRTDATG
jgi:hypothetical protein